MSLTLKPYPEYKDSGLPWLGKIPAHWVLLRTKYLFAERVQKGFPDEPLLAATQTKGVISKDQYESRTVVAQKDLHLLKLVEKGDFVISLRSFEGGIEYAHARGIISPAYTILRPSPRVRSDYFAFFFKSPDFVSSLSLFVTGIREGQNIDHDRLSRALLPLPPADEQMAIGRFLRARLSKVNRLIRARRRLIELLNEQKQAIIHRAVTRGLDPYVRFRPSGIEWLGDVPEHWDQRPAKYFYREIDDRSPTGQEELLSVSHITGVSPRSQKNVTMFMAASNVGHKICKAGDLVINTMWAWMAALGVAKQTGIVSPSYAVYRPKCPSAVVPEFADCLLRTMPYAAEYFCRSTGIRASRLRLYPEDFLRIPIVRPPLGEQMEIVAFVAEETRALESHMLRAQREIDLIHEYRARLVADVVTGKLDVRGVELPALEGGGAFEDWEEVGEEEADEIGETEEMADADE